MRAELHAFVVFFLYSEASLKQYRLKLRRKEINLNL